jgi:hypothetical protein
MPAGSAPGKAPTPALVGEKVVDKAWGKVPAEAWGMAVAKEWGMVAEQAWGRDGDRAATRGKEPSKNAFRC